MLEKWRPTLQPLEPTDLLAPSDPKVAFGGVS